MELEEVLEQIRDTEKRVSDLDKKYAEEENERAGEILWHKKERAEVKLDNLIDYADKIREGQETKKEKTEETKEITKENPEEDTVVCPECGGDFEEKEEGLFRCVNCGGYFEMEEEEE